MLIQSENNKFISVLALAIYVSKLKVTKNHQKSTILFVLFWKKKKKKERKERKKEKKGLFYLF